ncbi:MAG: phosphoglycerate dehydrogenase [Xanthomonadales bacterium]|nr:phosphoglycerate dehydrogenase [Xanthomonadales bacterium]
MTSPDNSVPRKIHSLDKSRINILLLEGLHPIARKTLESRGYSNITEYTHSLTGDDLADTLKGVHFIGIRSRTQLTTEVIQAADKLAAIGCFCIGTNQVDLGAAELAGIPVFNAPFSNTRSVAELAIGEMIMMMRGIPQRNAAAHRGEWLKSATGSTEIRAKTLGIIGYGHIGSQLGVLAEGLGMQVIYYDIADKLPMGNANPVDNLEQLLAESDVVTLHVPQTDATHEMFGADELNKMRRGSFLINLARGTVVQIDALHAAIESGHLAGASLDVFPIEPKSNSDRFVSPLCGLDNVILTPHIGGSTLEAQQNIAREVTGKLVKYSDNGTSLSAVNFPEVSMPDQAGNHRILHIHQNEPGVLQQINQVFSDNNVNISAQYLQTNENIGYVVMDIEAADFNGLLADLKAIPSTIRCRMLY